MTLTFDPQEPYVEMLMKISEKELNEFFDRLGVETIKDDQYEDEGLLYDDEG